MRAHTLIIRTLERELLDSEQLSLAEYDVLLRLEEAPDNRLRMSDIGARLLVTSGGATKLLDRMAKRGFTTREFDPNDRRVVYAALSEAGRKKLRSAARTHLGGVEKYFTTILREEEIPILESFFARVLSSCPVDDGIQTARRRSTK